MKILITGGAGFVGSALIRYLLSATSHTVVNVDALTYAANQAWLKTLSDEPRHVFERSDICDTKSLSRILRRHEPDAIINLAAESNVDRSIADHTPFIESNIVGTSRLLDEACRYFETLSTPAQNRFRFLHVSTDEVYGSRGLDHEPASEATAYAPSSPYSASKAAADHLVKAWHLTYGLPTLITHSSNNYGPYQHPDKLIPLTLRNALAGQPIPIYGDGRQRRDWLHVDDHVRALLDVLERGRVGERYNVATDNELTNIDLVKTLCSQLQIQWPPGTASAYAQLITFVQDRPGHDERYGMQASKIANELGWRHMHSFREGLADTVRWYLEHRHWLDSFPGPASGL